VLTNTQKAHVACSLGAAAAGTPVVWRMHDIVSPKTFGVPQRLALRVAGTVSRPRVLAVSDAAARAARRHVGLKDVRTIHNGIDASRRSVQSVMDLRQRFGWPQDAQVVGMLGRLVRWKGGEVFAEASLMIAARSSKARFVVAGDPILDSERNFAEKLQSRVLSFGLAAKFRFLPFHEDVAALLGNYDILVHPSIEPDPFPLSVIEALGCGVPVVAFRHGGVSEIVEDRSCGRLVPPCDIGGLAEACLDLLGDAHTRDRYARAAKTTAARFDAAGMCGAIARELFAMAQGWPPRRGGGPDNRPKISTRV
jgi:glycosyltransferase involved in cell wall biosynthesis